MSPRLLIIVAVSVASQASAYELRHDSTGEVVRWKGHVEFVLDQHAAIQLHVEQLQAAVSAAATTISQASGSVTVSVRVGQTQGVGYNLDGSKNQNDILVLEDWPYQDEALAATIVTVNASTHEIIDADIAINGEQHKFAVLEQANPHGEKDDVQNMLTHELGHALGLMHNSSDRHVVMYPASNAGEISKRVLAPDDSAGLQALYTGQASTSPESTDPAQPAVGCSSTGSSNVGWLAVLVAMSLLLRRRALWLLAAPAIAVAADRAPTVDLSSADQVSVGAVVSSKSSRVGGMIVTDLTIAMSRCELGTCSATVELRVPGGRVGDIEQSIVDHPVPRPGEALAVSRHGTHLRLHRISEPTIRSAFDAALRQAKAVSGATPHGNFSQRSAAGSPAKSR